MILTKEPLRPEVDRVNTEVDPRLRQARQENRIERRVAMRRVSNGVCHSLCLTWIKKKLTSHGRGDVAEWRGGSDWRRAWKP